MSLEVKVPTVGESINEVTLSKWIKKDGDYVNRDEVICELESDKATFELNAEQAGVLKTNAKEGDTLKIGDVVATIDTDAKAPAVEKKKEDVKEVKEQKDVEEKKEEPVKQQESKQQPAETSYAAGTASPAAAKIMAEQNVKVNGSGRGGRITKSDVLNAIKQGSRVLPSQSTEAAPTSNETNGQQQPQKKYG